uniref:GPI mannosyltransferase 2 n=1 Tax=Oncorhynchus kisutch TaxID=8019 RepID=A0A8C7D9F2_ONCKI
MFAMPPFQALLNAAIPDHEADAFTPRAEEEPLLLDPAVQWFLGGLSHWDAEHFLFIAERGYLCEHNYASFPLFPVILWGLPLSGCLTLRGCLLLAVALGNNALFLLSVTALYGLGRVVLQDRRLALVSSLLYYLTPANVFMMYSHCCTTVIALPFLVFQYYGYRAFCTPSLSLEQISPALIQLAEDQGYRVPDENAPPPLWCLRPLPLLYSHIQDVYWDVGFLLYFQLKQIPNFLLALPMATLDMVAAYIGENKRPDEPTPGFYSPRVFLYVVHATMLLGFGTFCMHVLHRTVFLYLSQNPIVHLLSCWKTCSIPTCWILGYFISYLAYGPVTSYSGLDLTLSTEDLMCAQNII